MRIVAEPIWTTTQLLIRLLGPSIQTGNYLVDARPRFGEAISFTIFPEMIRNSEVHMYFTGFFPFPDSIKVTLPNLSIENIEVIEVIPYKDESVTMQQDIDTMTPDEREIHQPAHAEAEIAEVSIPEFPPVWFDIDFARTEPLAPGPGGGYGSLIYLGGGQGRALSGMQRQRGQNEAPWLDSEYTRLEGAFENLLQHASFQPVALVPGLLDPVPVGWEMVPEDPLALLRVQADAGGLGLPSLTLKYRPRANDQSMVTNPALVLFSPVVPAGATFQVLIVPSEGNANGRVQLTTEDNAFSSAPYTFSSGEASVLRLNTPTAQRVKILWTQPKTDNVERAIRVYAPIASNYQSPHSWIQSSGTSARDIVSGSGITCAGGKWYFKRGHIRVVSSTDGIGQPLSWTLRSEVTGEAILSLNAGILSSDFATTANLNLGVLLGNNAGSYELVWSSPSDFSLVNGSNSTPIPFAIDPSIPTAIIEGTLSIEITSFSATSGSAIINHWSYAP